MKKLLFLFLLSVVLFSCKKEQPDVIVPPDNTTVNTQAGLGSVPGIPTGMFYSLPENIQVVGDIRGGIMGKEMYQDKTFKGPFVFDYKANWISYGTGTYVNLYLTLFNSSITNTVVSFPGGLIFVDSLDANTHLGQYQKGLILQNVNVIVNAQDSAFVHLRSYCLNAHLMPSNYDAVYYFGPITNNAQLNTVIGIMSTKQQPVGEEYNIQSIIWNVTDNGLTLTSAELSYLNGLP